MPTPPPDPTGRPSSAKRALRGEGSSIPESQPTPDQPDAQASTNSHHPTASPGVPLSTQTQPPAPPPLGSDILRVLADPGINPNLEALENTDEAPTVITRSIGNQPPPPAPLTVIASDPPQLAGRRLGHYELIEAIGTGGMATVLKARDLDLGRVVALKILPPSAAGDSESVTRFKQEARAAAMLDHENIARVYACGEDQGLHFIAFEFVEGINLRQLIERRGTIPAPEAVRYMIQVAAGLAHAAERGVVHRDIKPSNILITPDRRAKIVDMGLARQLEASANGGVTQSGVTLGTFDYISPEQALDPRRTDVRSDIYSLGCTFYHALTGRPPVPEGTAAKKLHAHQHTDPLDPRQIRDDIPDELVVILARMMAKDPEQRYQSPEELIAHLKGLAEQLRLAPEVVGHDSVVRAVRAASSVHPPRLRLGWVVAVASILVAVVAFALSSNHSDPISTPPPWAGEPKQARTDPPGGVGPGGKSTPEVPVDDGLVHNAEELAEKLAQASPADTTEIRLAPGTFDLTTLPDPVVFRGRELRLTGSVDPPTILRVHPASTSALTELPAGAFSVMGAGVVSITGVRFATSALLEELPDTSLATLVAIDVGELTLTDCVFPSPEMTGVGAVRVTRIRKEFRAERCIFAPASFALWLPDSCKATIFDCGFAPHETAIRVGESRTTLLPIEGPVQDVEITLARSSFLLDSNSAVLANLASGEGPGVHISAGYCVFATNTTPRAPATIPGGVSALLAPLSRPVIVRARTQPGEIRFTGEEENAYFGVAALALPTTDDEQFYTFKECEEKEFPVVDAGAVMLAQRPWAERDPLRTLTSVDRWGYWRAFGLNLREPGIFTDDKEVRLLGVQFHDEKAYEKGYPARRAYPDISVWPPPAPARSPTAPQYPGNVLVWYPKPDPKDLPLPTGVYTDLTVLLKDAKPGTEVLIRHNGLVDLYDTIKLEKPRGAGVPDSTPAPSEVLPGSKPDKPRETGGADFQITFKPDDGYTPILAAPGGVELDQTLFRLMNGKVAFHKLHFLLKPDRPRDGQTVAAVMIVGGEACEFRECVFTLAEEGDSKAVVVLVTDPKPVMAMNGASLPTPRVTFERCVIRGKGRGVYVSASRAVDVSISQSLTAINGPLYLAEPGGKAIPGEQSHLRLSRVTAFVGGPLVEMHGGRVGAMGGSGLVKLNVQADECLFAAVPGAGQPLVALNGVDPKEADKTLHWEVQSANRYANFDESARVMAVTPLTEGTMPKDWDWNQWIPFAREPAAGDTKRVGRVTFENPPTDLASLATFKPADAVVMSFEFPDFPKSIDVGAPVDKLRSPVGGEK